MADNFVSKFTVNSQGTDIDVKIKDTDARNLIAQEISDRNSAVTTITNNLNKEISDREGADTAITTAITNNLNKEISDRESADTTITNNLNKEISDRSALISKDSKGNTNVTSSTANVSITGKDVTLNASGTLGFNSTNPIKYSTKIEKVSEKYDGMAFKDSDNNTKHLLVATNHMEDTKKQIVVIGDSFSSTAQSKGPLWYTYVAKKYNADVITHASDGMGFIVGGDNNFYNQINKCAAEADIDNVMTVYIYGGLNDLTQFTSDSSGISTVFYQAVTNVISNAQLKFPKSEIVLVGINTFQQYNYYGTGLYGKNNAMFTMRIYMNYAAFKCKVKFIDITNQTLYTPEFYGDANDGGQKHPSALGEAYIANLILGGSPYKFDTREQPSMTGTNCTITSINTDTRVDEIWVHGTMQPSMTGTCVISFKGYTPPASEYVLFVCEGSRKATYGVVDVNNEQITVYFFDNEEYYFEFQLS